MRSKEALKELKACAISKWGHDRVDIIEKDLDRLERLEAIEDEMGIFLDALFNIYNKLCEQKTVYMKIGFQTKCFYYDYYLIDFKNKEIVCMGYEPEEWLAFKDYGITWALSREGLI